MPAQFKEAAKQQQLSWLTGHALQELVSFVDIQLQRLSGYDITAGHQDPDTADEIVSQFRAGSSHALELWSDPSRALANTTSLFAALGLAHEPCEAACEHVIAAILAATDKAAGKQNTTVHYRQTRMDLEDQARAAGLPC